MKKRVLCFALILMLLLSLAPVSGFAEGESGELATGDHIYMGEFEDSPIKWKVLDAEKMNNGEPGAFLFTAYVLKDYCTIYDEAVASWQGCVAQQWCAQFYTDSLSPAEQGAVPAVSKDEEEAFFYSLHWRSNQLLDEKVFFLSAVELAQYVGDHDGAEGISGYTAEGKLAYYWLRTPQLMHVDYAGLALQDNDVHDYLVYNVWGARPAMNLDTSKVLCLSPAYEGAEREWKLTLTDESRSLTVSNVTLSGETLTADYSGAGEGEGEYISLLVRDAEGKSVHSERLCPSAGSGSVELPLSGLDIPEGGTVSLCSEKDNGDYKTSYASAPCELSCELSFDAGEGSGTMEAVHLTPGVASALPDCGFTAPANQRFDHWEKDGEALDGQIRLSGDCVLKAIYGDIPVSSVSFDSAALELELFDETTVTAAVEPQDAADRSLAWSSDNKAVAVTDKGDGSCAVKAKFPGSAVISAASNDGGATGSLTVTVTGSAFTAYAVNYGLYALGFAVLALAAILLLRPKKGKSGKK